MFLFLSNTSLKKLELLDNIIFQNEQPDKRFSVWYYFSSDNETDTQ